jgi:hypothetical protein
MRFRWIAAVALWTVLSGPIFAPSTSAPSPRKPEPSGAAHSAPVRGSSR